MQEPVGDVASRAGAVTTVAELSELLRQLRRRDARRRQGLVLTYQQLAERTGWSVASVGAYLSGVTLAPADRFDQLLALLGAQPHEYGPLATARDRVDDGRRRPSRVIAGHTATSLAQTLAPARTLPAGARAFTGRVGALARLDGALASPQAPGAMVVTAVAGMGGVGKTTLAVHWGHCVAEYFPDGQLYVNLRGYDPAKPLSTLDAMGVLLGGLGLPLAAVPADEDGRLSLYRDVLGGRRMLVLLDNARSSAQVAPLLPPAPCLALITSRDELADLVADGEVRRIRLDVFAEEEAVALLRQLVGARADREPEAVRALARRCGYLPLALRVVAELAITRADAGLASLVDELDADLRATGLDAFASTGEARSDVRSVLSWSLRSLPEPAARALRLLGLVPGADLDEYGLAALAGVPPDEARDLLATLHRAHLVDAWPPGRYSVHDLVRAYARESARRDLDEADRRGATTRLLDYYLSATRTATRTVIPNLPPSGERAVPTSQPRIPDLDQVDAAAWLDAERGNVVAACLYAAHHGWPAHAVATAVELWTVLDGAFVHDAVTVHTAVLAAADALGVAVDHGDRARLLGALALAHYRLGDLDAAATRAQESVAVSRDAGDEGGTRLGLTALGAVRAAQGRFREALAAYGRALDITSGREPPAHAQALVNLGEVNLAMEQHEAAARHYRRAASLATAFHLRRLAVEAHRGIAMAMVRLGRFAEAVTVADQALAMTREHGFPARLYPANQVQLLDTAAQAYRGAGRLAEAIDLLAEAVRLCRQPVVSIDPAAPLLNTVGETYRYAGDHTLALASHEEALDFAERAGDRPQRTRALVGLGDAHAALGDDARARQLWQEALDHFTAMGLPSADVEQRLHEAGP